MTLSDEFRELNQRFLKAIEERNIEDKKFIKAARELINTVELLAEEIDGELDDYLMIDSVSATRQGTFNLRQWT